MSGCRILFVKHSLPWPRSSGQDVHAFHMMLGLADEGVSVGLTTVEPVVDEALGRLRPKFRATLNEGAPSAGRSACELPLSWFQERFRSYWGIDPVHIITVARQAQEFKADAVVTVGLEALPFLAAVRGPVRVWYAADEWVWHHLSQVRANNPRTWSNVRDAIVKGAYERAYGSMLDRVWVVSIADRRAFQWVTGVREVDVVPNGVDADFYRPRGHDTIPHSAVFWGRLDFGPNIQALQWFCRHVWPAILKRQKDATFTIIGFQPTDIVRELARAPGIRLLADLPDLREEVARHEIVVLPFVSGGGIKNKLLEAAALGKPIVSSPPAQGGVRRALRETLVCVRRPADWTDVMSRLWENPGWRATLGTKARTTVVQTHSWSATARLALEGLHQSLEKARC